MDGKVVRSEGLG